MKGYSRILRLLLKNMFRRSGDKKVKAWVYVAIVTVGLVFVLVIAGVCLTVSALAVVMQEMGKLPEFLAAALGLACLAIMIFGLVPMLTQLYFSRDSEFFLSLPVSSSAVFAAKLTVVYLTEIVLSTAVMVPCMITVGATLSLGPTFYIVMLLGIVTVPSIPLLLASVLAIPLMYLVSFFRNKGALTSIVMIVIFAGIFLAYYLILGAVSGGSDENVPIEEVAARLASGLDLAAKILFPVTAVTRLATLSDLTLFGGFSVPAAAAINAAVAVGSVVVLAALSVLISAAVYRRGVRGALAGSSSSQRRKAGFRTRSLVGAFIVREWRDLIRTPAFAFQCLSAVAISPIFTAFMVNSTTGSGEEAGLFVGMSAASAVVLIVMIMGIGLNIGAPTAFSREGTGMGFLKALPVSARDIVRAKHILYVIISTITVALSVGIAAIFAFDVVSFVGEIVFLLVYNYAYNCFCLLVDLSRPKLRWSTTNEVVKNNRNALLATFVNMGVAFVAFIAVLVATILRAPLHAMIAVWACLSVLAAAAAVALHLALYHKCQTLFSNIEV